MTHLPPGTEPIPPGTITNCVILRRDGLSVVSLPSGDINVDEHPSTGAYIEDTRVCSRLTFLMAGAPPVLLDEAQSDQGHSAVFTNPLIEGSAGRIEPRSLLARRTRVISDGLIEALTVSNYSAAVLTVELEYQFDADFADIFEVRGYPGPPERHPIEVSVQSDRVSYWRPGLDGRRRAAAVSFSPAPVSISPNSARFLLDVEPRGSAVVQVAVHPHATATTPAFEAAVRAARQKDDAWRRSLTRLTTDNEVLNAALDGALLDIEALRMTVEGETFIAAGVPWFDTLFGRDSLLTGMMLAPYSTAPLRAALKVLANHQASGTDPLSDATPGKIPHELRWGELSRAGHLPFAKYYGSIDSTPLFLMAASDYLRWTGDTALISSLRTSIEGALAWCEAEVGRSGLLAYERTSEHGLENQGWKDSHDATVWPTGDPVAAPIGLVEVQGYAYAAGRACQDLGAVLGEELGARGAGLAALMGELLESHFRDADLGYVFCLDGARRPVATATSNPGHLLWAGAASDAGGAQVAQRLLGDDLFSGWGVRTLGTESRTFNPLGYHTGSVWPHENALIVAGLRRYGHDEEALKLSSALIQAGLAFPGARLPELFCGDPRGFRPVPTPYPVASRPQAWSSAALPYTLMAMLGICIGNGSDELMVVRPVLPLELSTVTVSGLRFGSTTVDLRFEGHEERTRVEVSRVVGPGRVVFANAWANR
ncbi:MAG TPA: glycogen debranching N-terminal domain-containing protein [Tepidiformaceae bacterium]|nr:glycogen debranching N-terminal domain-containing protein [Tepidiformaceae bacterium]